MAGIGDYIHLRNSDYQRYGTTYRGPSNYSNAFAVFSAQRSKILNKIKTSTNGAIAGLENYLNGLLYGIEGNAAQYYEEEFSKYREVVEQIFSEKYGQFDFNVAQGLNVYQKMKNISTSKSSRKTLDRSQLENYLKQIVLMINGNIGLKQGTDVMDIMRVKTELENYLNSHSEGMIIRKADNMNLINDINRVLAYQSFPRPLAIGDIGEIFLAAASAKANDKAEKVGDQLINEIKKSIVGGLGSKATIQGDKFDDKYVDLSKILVPGWQHIDENNSWQLSTESQDKVDVYFDWHGQTLAISAKNYNLTDYSREIHILSGSNLLYLIANEDDQFVNHWLNLISTSNRETDSNNSALLQAAHEAMKITILIKGLTGQDLGRNSTADTFVLNDRHSRHVYIFTMRQLADRAISRLNNINFGGYPNNGLRHEYVGDNPSQELAMTRITNLLKSVYNCKISIALQQEIFLT